MNDLNYWEECISIAADECNLSLTSEQLHCLAESVSGGHDNYGMAFYSPSSNDRVISIEREWESKLNSQKEDHEKYVRNAESAVKRALKINQNESVNICDHGEVNLINGRTTRI